MKATPAEYLPKIAAPLQNKPVRVVDGREANMMLYCRSEWVRMVTAWGKLFRRELLETERFPDVKLHEDEALIYKLLYRSRQVAMVDGALYLYTANQGGLMANRYTPERMTMLDILDERLAFYRENGETGDLIRFTQNRQFMFAVLYYQHAKKEKDFQRKARKKQWNLYWKLLRSAYPLKRKLIYTYAMVLPMHFTKLYF